MLYQPENGPVLNLFSLKGTVSLVTGGSRGIGLAAAIGLAEAGSEVAITYNSSSSEEVKELEAKYKFKAYKCNVTHKEDIEELTQRIVEELGRLDVVVPNAGIVIYEDAEEFSYENYRKTMDVNLDGAFFTAQAAANAFKKQKEAGILQQGKIIFTASVSSLIVNYPQKQAPYNASKAGLVRLAKCLAVEWVDFARVNCVSPGYITTEMISSHPKEWQDTWSSMIPAQRSSETYELKGLYVFLASNASSYVTGEEIVAGGGYTLT